MGKPAPNAFTLVELLVVIAVTSIIGVYTLANYRSFGEDQNLKSAVLDIQSLLRQAQINATSGVKCQGVGELGWFVVYTNTTTLDLKCNNSSGSSSSLKTLSLTERSSNISIQSITAGSDSCSIGTTFTFVPPSGTMISSCGTNPNLVTITLTNNTTTKSFNIEKGGRIYAP